MEYRLIFDVTDTYVRPIKQKLKNLPLTDISDRHCADPTGHRAAAFDQLIVHAFDQLIE